MVIELYRISIGSELYLFTASQEDITHQGLTWRSQPIERAATIEQSDDALKVDTHFEVAAGNELAEIALNPPLNHAPQLTIYRSEDGGSTFETVFTGRIISGVWNEGWVKVELAPVHSEFQVTGLIETITPLCRYTLGSRKCTKIIKAAYATVATCEGTTITLHESLPLQYQYGYLRHGQDSHFIDAQPNSNQLSLLHPASLAVGSRLEIYQGCDRTLQCCHTRFANSANFGGAANLPTKNPYVGDPIDR